MSPLVVARGLGLSRRLVATDLDLMAGEMVCLIGPNGSGKTSLMHALANIGSPSGSLRIDGVDPKREPPSRRSRLLSYLSASRDLAWPLIARDLISLGQPKDVAPARIEEMLALFELKPLADRSIDRLSTGERSRLLIARALAPDPMLLLLDEPIANLDPLWQIRLLEQLQRLAHRGSRAILIALHDLDLARRYADRLLIMNEGRIEADGPAQNLVPGPEVERIFGITASPEGWLPLR